MQQRPDYGIDGPLAVMAMIIVSGILFGIVAAIASLGGPHPFRIPACAAISLVGADLLGVAGCMLWYSRFEKLRLRERPPDRIPCPRDEIALHLRSRRDPSLLRA